MRELDVYPMAVRVLKASLNAGAQVRGQWRGTCNFSNVPVTVESHQAMKARQQNQVATAFAFDDALYHSPDPAFIQQSID